MYDLSVIIPARNEEWLAKTIESVLSAARAQTEVIAILDGYWPVPGIPDRKGVRLIHHCEPIGQRAATNEGVRLSEAKYVMKLDAHCSLMEGFDVELMKDFEYDWTVVPTMYNLHVFDWQCKKCGDRRYMGPLPTDCPKCDNKTNFEKVVVWQPRRNRRSDFMRFDRDLHFQYWNEYRKRPAAKGEICDQMCCVGACWMMDRHRYWELDGMDEGHGSWGQMGVELACKSWLSGGRQVVNKRAWFAHLFRTQEGFGFPYPNPGITQARQYSKYLWIDGNWPKAKYPLSWLINKFAPVPDWN
jgi:glycosyltransferase involved in cell wall biosynthesis